MRPLLPSPSNERLRIGARLGRGAHTWRNASEGPSEVLWVIAPAPWSGSH